MPTEKGGVYQRGGFWLDLARGAGGKPISPKWYIWWYDPARGRQRRKSTGTDDLRLAHTKLDEHYLATLRPTDNDQAVYDVSTAIADYYIEHGAKQTSAEAIKARLKLFSRFLDAEADAGRLSDPFLPDQVDNLFLDRFRNWALDDPIVAKKKDRDGNWVDGNSRPRQASTVEESVIQLKAAINHALNNRRIRYAPTMKHKTRAAVTPVRTYRLTVSNLAEMLDFTMQGSGRYAGHAALLVPLRRYLIGAICTLARPDAILDISVETERAQWMRDDRRLNLNPAGRQQTKKHRPIVPVNDLLHEWLSETDEWFVCKERNSLDPYDQTPVVEQIGVKAVRSGWDSMRQCLNIPDGWGPKLIRHSMSSELRKRRVDPWELSGQLGHRVLKTSETYAIYDPDYLGTVQMGIKDVLADLEKACGSSIHPTFTQLSRPNAPR